MNRECDERRQRELERLGGTMRLTMQQSRKLVKQIETERDTS